MFESLEDAFEKSSHRWIVETRFWCTACTLS